MVVNGMIGKRISEFEEQCDMIRLMVSESEERIARSSDNEIVNSGYNKVPCMV